MDYREKYTGSKEEFYFFLKDKVIKLFKDKLKIDGNLVVIPNIEDLDYLIKITGDNDYGDLTIKVKWGEKNKQKETNKKNTKQYEEFEENSKQGKEFKEKNNKDNDGMEINTSVTFDY